MLRSGCVRVGRRRRTRRNRGSIARAAAACNRACRSPEAVNAARGHAVHGEDGRVVRERTLITEPGVRHVATPACPCLHRRARLRRRIRVVAGPRRPGRVERHDRRSRVRRIRRAALGWLRSRAGRPSGRSPLAALRCARARVRPGASVLRTPRRPGRSAGTVAACTAGRRRRPGLRPRAGGTPARAGRGDSAVLAGSRKTVGLKADPRRRDVRSSGGSAFRLTRRPMPCGSAFRPTRLAQEPPHHRVYRIR